MFKLKQPLCDAMPDTDTSCGGGGIGYQPSFSISSPIDTVKLIIKDLELKARSIRLDIENSKPKTGLVNMLAWHLGFSNEKKRLAKKLEKTLRFQDEVEVMQRLCKGYSTPADAVKHYSEQADKEHAIAAQWHFGGRVNQAHIQKGNTHIRTAKRIINTCNRLQSADY